MKDANSSISRESREAARSVIALGQNHGKLQESESAIPAHYPDRPVHHQQPNNPLHGITLESILTRLVAHYGWVEMGKKINIRCFNNAPSIKSSLQFLRKTPWARAQVEALYVHTPLENR